MKPRSSGSNLKVIMTRVSLLSQRHSAILARLPPWPTLSIPHCFPNPRLEVDAPHKRARDDAFLPSKLDHEFGQGRPDSEATVAHDQCQARGKSLSNSIPFKSIIFIRTLHVTASFARILRVMFSILQHRHYAPELHRS